MLFKPGDSIVCVYVLGQAKCALLNVLTMRNELKCSSNTKGCPFKRVRGAHRNFQI